MNNPPIAIGGIPVNAAVQESGAFALEANTTRDSTYLQILGALVSQHSLVSLVPRDVLWVFP